MDNMYYSTPEDIIIDDIADELDDAMDSVVQDTSGTSDIDMVANLTDEDIEDTDEDLTDDDNYDDEDDSYEDEEENEDMEDLEYEY